MKTSFLAFILLINSMLFTFAGNEVWINSTGGSDGSGTGTAADPYICSSETTFDTLLDGSSIPTNSTIHLMAGTFQTIGFVPLKPGWKLRGAGIDVTTVQLKNLGASPPDSGLQVLGNSYTNFADRVEVSDMTVDCNLQNQSAPLCVQAVWLMGSDERISRVKAINWGSSDGVECFIFVVGTAGYPYPAATNSMIDDCIVEQPAQVTQTGMADGFCVGGSPATNGQFTVGSSGWNCGTEIRNCRIFNVPTGGGMGIPTGFNGISVGNGVYAVKIDNNIEVNVAGTAIFSSCGSLVNCTIENNMLSDVGGGIGIAGGDYCLVGDSNSLKENIVIDNNLITVQSGGSGMDISGLFGQDITNLTVNNNIIEAAGGAGAVNGLVVHYTDNFNAQNNILDANGGGEPLEIATNVIVSQIINNQSLSGASVTTPLYQSTNNAAYFVGNGSGLTDVIAQYLGTRGSSVEVSSDGTTLSYGGGTSAHNAFSFGTNSTSGASSWAVNNSLSFDGGQSEDDSLAFDGGLASYESLAFGFNHASEGGDGQYAYASYGSLAFGYNYGIGMFPYAYSNSIAIGSGIAYLNSFADGSGGGSAPPTASVNSFAWGHDTIASNYSIALDPGAVAENYAFAFYNGKAYQNSVALGSWAYASNNSMAFGWINPAGDLPGATNFQWVAAGFTNGYSFRDGPFTIGNNLNVGGVVSGNGSGLTNLSYSTRPLLFAVLTNGLTISNSVYQRIWFNDIISSNNLSYSTNSGITIGTAGVYSVSVTVGWQGVSGNTAAELFLMKNGVYYLMAQENPSENQSLTLTADVPFSAGDTADFQVWQNLSPSATVAGRSVPYYQTYLSFRLIQ